MGWRKFCNNQTWHGISSLSCESRILLVCFNMITSYRGKTTECTYIQYSAVMNSVLVACARCTFHCHKLRFPGWSLLYSALRKYTTIPRSWAQWFAWSGLPQLLRVAADCTSLISNYLRTPCTLGSTGHSMSKLNSVKGIVFSWTEHTKTRIPRCSMWPVCVAFKYPSCCCLVSLRFEFVFGWT